MESTCSLAALASMRGKALCLLDRAGMNNLSSCSRESKQQAPWLPCGTLLIASYDSESKQIATHRHRTVHWLNIGLFHQDLFYLRIDATSLGRCTMRTALSCFSAYYTTIAVT